MSGSVRCVEGTLAGVLLLVTGCASPAGAERNASPWLVWHATNERIELRSDRTALCVLEEQVYRGVPDVQPSKRGYLVSYDEEDGRYLERVVAAMVVAGLPSHNGHGYPISIELHRPSDAAARLSFDSSVMDAYPVWRGIETQLDQLVQMDLLYGVFYREIAESCAVDGSWEQASGIYLRALRELVRWNGWLCDRSGRSYIDDSELLLTEPQVLHNSRRYSESVEKSREAWLQLSKGVVVSGQGEVRQVKIPDLPARPLATQSSS